MITDSLSTLTILIVAVLFLKFLFPVPQKLQLRGRYSLKTEKRDAGIGRDRDHRFNAVSIISGSECCSEIKAIKGKRFIPQEVPILPLQDCSSNKCNCRYAHHVDRRCGTQRRALHSIEGDAPTSSQKQIGRESKGRRPNDSSFDVTKGYLPSQVPRL